MAAPGPESLAAHTLANAHGDVVELLGFGARVAALRLQLAGGPRNVVLGYPAPADYLADRFYMGGIVGRCCNRIGGARFELDGVDYALTANEGSNQLHGGRRGFDRRAWEVVAAGESRLVLGLRSADGDQGYPGNLTARAAYDWSEDRTLTVVLSAVTDRPTHVNLTSHVYWNLDGPGATVLGHSLAVGGGRYTPTDEALIPTGDIASVAGTDLDLRAPRRVGALVASPDPRVRRNRGADFNYVLDAGETPAAELWSSRGDLKLTLTTSNPGLQVYTGQHLAAPFVPYGGLCLEPQRFPDSPNRPSFPSTLLAPGEEYRETIRYAFRVTRLEGAR